MEKKNPGCYPGHFLLFLLNLVRIISLFLTGVYYPDLSDVMHTEVWQVVFILAAVLLWAAWIYYSLKNKGHEESKQVILRFVILTALFYGAFAMPFSRTDRDYGTFYRATGKLFFSHLPVQDSFAFHRQETPTLPG